MRIITLTEALDKENMTGIFVCDDATRTVKAVSAASISDLSKQNITIIELGMHTRRML